MNEVNTFAKQLDLSIYFLEAKFIFEINVLILHTHPEGRTYIKGCFENRMRTSFLHTSDEVKKIEKLRSEHLRNFHCLSIMRVIKFTKCDAGRIQ